MNRARLTVVFLFVMAEVFSFRATADDPQPPEGDNPPTLPALTPGETDTDQQEQSLDGVNEILDEAIKKLARTRNTQALRLLRKKDYPGALEKLKQAYELDSDDPEIVNNLGHIYHLLGNLKDAEIYYHRAIELDPERYITYLNLGDLLGREGETPQRLEESARMLVKARELKGNRPKLILKQARVASIRGKFDEAARFYSEYTKLRAPTDKLLVEIGDFYRDLGRTDEALTWYQKVEPSDEINNIEEVAASRIWEIEVERQAKKYGWTPRPETIPGRARMLATRGRILLNQEKFEEAERMLKEAVSLAPGFAMARADLGDLLRETGHMDTAELAYLRALAVDHSNAEICARLGELYLAQSGDGRAAEAALFLTRAIEMRPDWTELELVLSRALRASGDLVGALQRVERYLATAAPGQKLREAMRLKKEIEQLLPSKDREYGQIEDPQNRAVDKALSQTLGRVRLHLAKGRPEAAMVELSRLSEDQRGVDVLNLEARILYSSGHLDEAAKKMNESLTIDAGQSDIYEQLGQIVLSKGRLSEARGHFKKAEELGDAAATYHLARLDLGEEDESYFSWIHDIPKVETLVSVRDRLDSFLKLGSTSIYLSDAKILREQVGSRLRRLVAMASVVLFLLVVIMIAIIVRTWGGSDLAALISKHPESGPEVQRVLSAIRHEVLKHNTMVLSGLVEAIEQGGEDQAEKASYFCQSLLGDGEEGSAVARRLHDYADQLKKIGRSYGVRLNLGRKDPAIGALLKGFGKLEEVAPMLERIDTLRSSEKSRVLRTLRSAFKLLNTRGYEAVRSLLDRLRVLEVDKNLLDTLFDRVYREPAFAGISFKALSVESDVELPRRVLIAGQAFEDIMMNLVRNAVQSSIEHGHSPVEIGLLVTNEVNMITGIESAVFLVRDKSGKELTTEMIRGRYIEEGLGLTADLVSRYEGTMDVLAGEDGWSKAVRIKLPEAPISEEGE